MSRKMSGKRLRSLLLREVKKLIKEQEYNKSKEQIVVDALDGLPEPYNVILENGVILFYYTGSGDNPIQLKVTN
tara:strand:- start:7275 stop:7496 length:222 start_codon:yes stop_codon:yes gene_type:complete